MLIQPTLDSLNRLKLHGMAAALAEQLTQSATHGLAFEERFSLLLERELVYRDNRRLTRLLQLAALKQRACLEDLDYAGVVELTRQLRDQRLNLDIGRPPMLSQAVLRDVERSVVAALPVDDGFDPRFSDPRHDLLDHGAQDPLAPFVAGCRMAPSAGQVGAEGK